MEEKILIQSDLYNVKKICWSVFLILTIVVNVVVFSIWNPLDIHDYQYAVVCCKKYNRYVDEYKKIAKECKRVGDMDGYAENLDWANYYKENYLAEARSDLFDEWNEYIVNNGPLYAICGAIAISLLLYLYLAKTALVVSNRRVYGKTFFGKRVDLPIDSISAIGSSWPKGIAVSTSSGKIVFLLIKNRNDIHACISNILVERQKSSVEQPAPQNIANDLKAYNELLTSGVITQEEFDAKKKQLLGL